VTKASFEASLEDNPDQKITIRDSDLLKYVSRGGIKMEAALSRTKISVEGKTVLDLGISTGGFSDCLLQKKAERVVGVDVGHGQLHPSLEKKGQLVHFEGVNARELTPERLGESFPPRGFDLIVIDVSFISLEIILPVARNLLSQTGQILSLVKPQFEVGPQGLSKGGLVKDPKAFEEVKKKIYRICKDSDLQVEDYFESSITGTDGNKEYFVWARPDDAPLSGLHEST
jgi:23S rRNA (cytidine1920-2'-O)/16S rRNA (cytidine1409-2'-O)-methyltransferase